MIDPTSERSIGIAAVLVLVVGPVLLGSIGWVRSRRAPASARPGTVRRAWARTTQSALLYTLAFNLTFLIQELFLVLPKAFVPGLRPTLFHNDHRWEGDDPVARLLQGTGVLAIVVTAAISALLLRRLRRAPTAVRLLLFWMVYCGGFMALPQVVVGAVSPQSDVGMALVSLGLGPATKATVALVALVAIPVLALRLEAPLLGLAATVDEVSGPAARTGFVFRLATLPALFALPLIVAFRMPREWVEVVLVPVVVSLVGVAWLQAGAWRATDVRPAGRASAVSIAWPLAAVVLLLLIFQLVLRPGIRFA